MQLTFLGATQNVTGSRFLLEAGGLRLLIDCGLFQERSLQSRNWERFPVDPASIDTLLLTHAHVDHCGYLPKFIKEGFSGKIICTRPTVDITKISLLDSAKLQELDAAYKKKRHKKEGRQGPHLEIPLYTTEDAINVFNRFQPIEYEESKALNENLSITYFDAGHILGSAMIEIVVKEEGQTKKIIFSGDIGRWHRPLLQDPHLFESADYVVMEATYGNRRHEDETDALEKFGAIINETIKRHGNVVIPTFAIGRTQELLYNLNQLRKKGKLSAVKTFVDSPMAMNVTEIFERYPNYFDKEAQQILKKYEELFDFPDLCFCSDSTASRAINQVKEGALIMAGSGMCTGGRIKHHLANNISRPQCTILFVGYQAEGTLGRQILERPKEVRIFGQKYPVLAKVEKINGFSAHADKDELLKWVGAIRQKPKKVFIVHAEKKAADDFAATLKTEGFPQVVIPAYQEHFDLF